MQLFLENDNCEKQYSQPICHGFRCKLGQCLSEDKLCDGKINCHDGSDEKNCNKEKLKGNQTYISKYVKLFFKCICLCEFLIS